MNFEADWSWLETMLVILVISLVIFCDVRYQPVRRRLLRVSFSMVALVALVFLYFEPTLWVTAPVKSGVIFSEPITTTQKDSILQNSNLIELSAAEDPDQVPYSLAEIQVYGDGLEPWELQRFDGYKIRWEPLPDYEGITAVQVPEITEGIPYNMLYDISAVEPFELTVIHPNGKEITQSIKKGDAPYHFESIIEGAGLFEYHFWGIRDQDTLFTEVLPVEVLPARKANVLILGSFPSFEMNYLKNHLGDLGFGIANRIQLSQGVFHTEFLNMSDTDLSSISKPLLDQFKLVIMDGNTLALLNRRERQEIFRFIALAQLGLFLLIEDKSELSVIASLSSVRGNDKVLVTTSEKQISLLKMPFRISDPEWEPLIFQDQEVGAVYTRGIGKIGFSMVTNSHVLELQGAPEVYGQLWEQLLSPVIGFEITENPFYIPTYSFLNRQVDIGFSYFGKPLVAIDEQAIPPINSPIRPDLWTISYWPKQTGWHTLQVDGVKKAHFFVHASNDWRALQRYEKQVYNRHFFATNRVAERASRPLEKPISRWIPFILFLVAMTGLWLERKLS